MTARFVNQRVAPVPMEPNGILAVPDAETGGLTALGPVPGAVLGQARLVGRLGLERSPVRVIAPGVGGGFGAKVGTYPEQLVVAALARSPRPPGPVHRDALGEHGRDDAGPRAGPGRADRREARREITGLRSASCQTRRVPAGRRRSFPS